MEALAQQTGIEYKHVTYDGGNPAVIATVAGETEVTTQLASEQAEMIRGGRLRPLAVLGAEPLELAGHGTIPSVTDRVPESRSRPTTSASGRPRTCRPRCSRPWISSGRTRSRAPRRSRSYAADRGALFTPYYGEEAQERAMGMVRQNAWLLHDAGKAPKSPDAVRHRAAVSGASAGRGRRRRAGRRLTADDDGRGASRAGSAAAGGRGLRRAAGAVHAARLQPADRPDARLEHRRAARRPRALRPDPRAPGLSQGARQHLPDRG